MGLWDNNPNANNIHNKLILTAKKVWPELYRELGQQQGGGDQNIKKEQYSDILWSLG